MVVKQYDWVKLNNGEMATIVEVFSETDFLADIGSGPDDWDTVPIKSSDISEVYGPRLKKVKVA